MINLDANANYSLIQEIVEFLKELKPIGNPSSVHALGQHARALIEEARLRVGRVLNLNPSDRVVFTSGATESNNTAIHSALYGLPLTSISVVTSSIEHPCVLECLESFRRGGAAIRLITPKDPQRFSPSDFLSCIDASTKFVSVMLANNETGHILPVAQIFSEIRRLYPQVILHCDAAQALGKIPVDFQSIGADLLSISAHKIGALCGVGALVIRAGYSLTPLIVGGSQELRLRAGTENVIGIASFGIACAVLEREFQQRVAHMQHARDRLRAEIRAMVPEAHFTLSDSCACLPNTLSVRLPGVRADDLVIALDLEGIAASSGAACSSGKQLPSHVLMALGLSEDAARQTVRFSFEGRALANLGAITNTITRVIRNFYEQSKSR